MKFLLDQNFDRRLVQPLRQSGHDLKVVAVDYPSGLRDEEVLSLAVSEDRIILTNDRDFGELAVKELLPHAGIIYLRMRWTTAAAKWDRLSQVLTEYSGDLDRFLVVTDSAVRIL